MERLGIKRGRWQSKNGYREKLEKTSKESWSRILKVETSFRVWWLQNEQRKVIYSFRNDLLKRGYGYKLLPRWK